jgi:hypothetical protein
VDAGRPACEWKTWFSINSSCGLTKAQEAECARCSIIWPRSGTGQCARSSSTPRMKSFFLKEFQNLLTNHSEKLGVPVPLSQETRIVGGNPESKHLAPTKAKKCQSPEQNVQLCFQLWISYVNLKRSQLCFSRFVNSALTGHYGDYSVRHPNCWRTVEELRLWPKLPAISSVLRCYSWMSSSGLFPLSHVLGRLFDRASDDSMSLGRFRFLGRLIVK